MRSDSTSLTLYFDKDKLEMSEIDEFNSGIFVVSKSIEVEGEWHVELEFEHF